MSTFSDRLIGRAAAALDHAANAVVHVRQGIRKECVDHAARVQGFWDIHAEYGAPHLYSNPDAYFTPPPPMDPRLQRVRDLPEGGVVTDASWQSRFEPYSNAMRSLCQTYPRNATCHARLYLHPEPRPTLVLIHGYMGGAFRFEELVWPVRSLYRKGVDLALIQLPFHGARAVSGSAGQSHPFPSTDPRITNEGFRQSVHDVRALVRWLRYRGSAGVGLIGMSLGGYTTALMATVEPDLRAAVPIIPLASIADFAKYNGRLGTRHQVEEQHRALEAANFVVSPCARVSLVAPERMLIVAAESDRITPVAHADRLARHFGAQVVRFPGSHLMHRGIRNAWRAVDTVLQGAGLYTFDPHEERPASQTRSEPGPCLTVPPESGVVLRGDSDEERAA